jgi:hypothetical protein
MNSMTPSFIFFAVLLIASLYSGIYIFHMAGKYRIKHLQILIIIGLLYPVGKSLQRMHIGPRFIRWYLADVGFVPMAACIPLILFFISNSGEVRTFRKAIISARIWADYSCVIAVFYEVLTLYVGQAAELKGVKLSPDSARGDYIDAVCYIVMYIVTCMILKGMKERHKR